MILEKKKQKNIAQLDFFLDKSKLKRKVKHGKHSGEKRLLKNKGQTIRAQKDR